MNVSELNPLAVYKPQGQSDSSHPRLMLFSPWYYGHHPSYLRHLIRYWLQQNLPGTLSIVVMPTFLKAHQDIVALAEESQSICFVPLTLEEEAYLESATSNARRSLVQYNLIIRYAKKLQASQGLLLHFDSCLAPLALGLKLPCPFSGIYFRPTLHYSKFSGCKPSFKERLQQGRERMVLSRLLAHPQLKTLFCLDQAAVHAINERAWGQTEAVYLPDPVEFSSPCEQDVVNLRSRLEIEPKRQVFLAFGALADDRKGTKQLFDALPLLGSELCERLCILLVGEPFQDRQTILEAWLSPVREMLPVQIVTHFGYVPEAEVPLYFQLADAVLAPYQKHIGMSGILLLAAAAQKPVLSSSYGLMGEVVRRYSLGLALDTTLPSEIAKGLVQLLTEPADSLRDSQKMKALAELNSVENFASTIFQHIYGN